MRVIEIFKELTKIPRCSGTYEPFINFIQNFAQQNNFSCEIDPMNNILCYKPNGKRAICLQSHYDIVCLEDGKVPELIESQGYLEAKDSTLGADNGIGCSYMLALMEQGIEAEYLFTSDEEIGLIGANNIQLPVEANKMLNLDSEMEGEICIGCAGGVDIFATTHKGEYLRNVEKKDLYEISIENLDGGHSGVDIDKNIPNAIKLIAKSIKECDGDLLDLQGGERINSIPKSAKAIIVSNSAPTQTHPNMKIEKSQQKTLHYKKLDPNIIDFLYIFANGVRGYDKEVGVVIDSINLATIKNTIDGVQIALSARSMQSDQLQSLTQETVMLLKLFGFEVSTSGKYPPWKPQKSSFVNEVFEVYKKDNPKVSVNAIHAGLECAILKQKYPQIEVCSIGPNIYFPHSNKERCEINSIGKVFEVVQKIVQKQNET
jgi:dipeptidase D